ncbi:MAG: ribonuclease III [Candidatus Wolfebacteria bacterium]|nr:ribonuclease III [Candidatus Wolfebacteria bacterium]
MDLSSFEKKIKYNFKNQNLLKEALTHRSYINENPDWGVSHNERLEFLGDAVLELTVTEILFLKYSDMPEGELTSIRAALVNYQMLAEVAKIIGLEEVVLLSKGETKDTGRAREVILANALEALLGALYLDSGYEITKNFVSETVLSRLSKVMSEELYKDPKSYLQEITQEKMKLTPAYEILSEEGPDHAKVFESGVYFGKKLIAVGKGFSKQEAEVEAAKKALEEISQ